jgi:hypothetical protein
MPRFLLFGLVAAIAVAWLGATVHQSGHAPLGLVSIGVGLTLGAALFTLAVMLGVNGRPGILIAACVLAVVAVITQHAWLYADFRREWHEGRDHSAHVAMFRAESPWSPSKYFAQEATPRRIALWCADAALIVASAYATVWLIGGRRHVYSASRPTPKNQNPDT